MDIRAQLLSELSRVNVDYTILSLGNNKEYFDELIQIILDSPDPLPMRASWVAEGITSRYPGLIKPYTGRLIKRLRNFTHQGTRRNLLKIFTRMDIPVTYHGILLDICFETLLSEEKSVAEKVFCMQIIANHLKYYPELKNEFLEMLEDQIPKNSAGFKSRANQIRAELSGRRRQNRN